MAARLMTPSEAIALQLKKHGVRYAFGIIGSAFMDASDLWPAVGIQVIDTVHEANAGFMAIGIAMKTGETVLVTGQNYPGITNYPTAIGSARWANAPVLLFSPEPGTPVTGKGGFQEGNYATGQMDIFRPLVKWQELATNPTRIAETLARALDAAQRLKGPAQVDFFRDQLYLEAGYEYEPREPVIPAIGAGSPDDVAKAVEMIASAKNPVILGGYGVILSDGQQSMESLAELIGAPMATSYQHNDVVNFEHPQSTGPLGYNGHKAAMRLISEADLVIALGTRLGPFGVLRQYDEDYWPTDAKIIQIVNDGEVAGKSCPVDLAILGDARHTADALIAGLQGIKLAGEPTKADRLARITSENAVWEGELEAWTHESDAISVAEVAKAEAAGEKRIHPRQLLWKLRTLLSGDETVVTDIGNVCAVANAYLRFKKLRTFLHPATYGACGFALGTAMGAKIACPEETVIALSGDGAFGISCNELATCSRKGIGITAVVFCNDIWGAEQKNQRIWFGDRRGATEFQPVRYAAIAEAMDCKGVVVDNLEDFEKAFLQSVADQAKAITTVIEVRVHKELGAPFREDAMQHARRLLPEFADYNSVDTTGNAAAMGVDRLQT